MYKTKLKSFGSDCNTRLKSIESIYKASPKSNGPNCNTLRALGLDLLQGQTQEF